jgi:hypothetical protein
MPRERKYGAESVEADTDGDSGVQSVTESAASSSGASQVGMQQHVISGIFQGLAANTQAAQSSSAQRIQRPRNKRSEIAVLAARCVTAHHVLRVEAAVDSGAGSGGPHQHARRWSGMRPMHEDDLRRQMRNWDARRSGITHRMVDTFASRLSRKQRDNKRMCQDLQSDILAAGLRMAGYGWHAIQSKHHSYPLPLCATAVAVVVNLSACS